MTSPSIFRDTRLREALLWCLPALVLGAALRVWMEVRMPYGYMQFDTADFLVTPFRWLSDHRYVLHSKKAFFTPTFFTIPFLLHVRALIFIPVAQYVMGLMEVFLAGLLVRIWFPMWRWIIVPATLLVAASPWQLWYEQTLMGEANYVFFLVLVAVVGTLWAERPGWGRFAVFAVALFCIAGTRAEGKLMLGFGVLLAPVVLWRRWLALGVCVVCLAGVWELGNLHGGGSHAFSLLYATLFEFTPDDIRSEPETAPYLLPLRDEIFRPGNTEPVELVGVAKRIYDALLQYLKEKRGITQKVREPISEIEKNLCVEILTRRPLEVALTPVRKFRLASDGWASGADFGVHFLGKKQAQAISRLDDEAPVLSPGLTGRELDEAGLEEFAAQHYDAGRMEWFNAYERAWGAASVAVRLPDRWLSQPRAPHDFISTIPNAEWMEPGVPVYFLLAFAGMAAAVAMPGAGRHRWTQGAFLAAMLFTWYMATMVGVTNARFRFAYEPFCYLYGVAAVAWACGGLARLAKRKPAEEPPCAASS